jgi:hypothetical protein
MISFVHVRLYVANSKAFLQLRFDSPYSMLLKIGFKITFIGKKLRKNDEL